MHTPKDTKKNPQRRSRGPGKATKAARDRKPEVVPVEERYGAVPPDLAGLDREELPLGDEQEQLAAHGPEGDASISTEGADALGIGLEETPYALEALREAAEEEVERAEAEEQGSDRAPGEGSSKG